MVFYKVGHHASHNATARARGLELMTDPRLCAAIPVVEAVAKVQGPGRKTPGKGWKMPFNISTRGSRRRPRAASSRATAIPRARPRPSRRTDAGVSVRHEDPDTGGRWVELTFPLEPTPR